MKSTFIRAFFDTVDREINLRMVTCWIVHNKENSTINPLSLVTLSASNNTFEDYGLKGQANFRFNTLVHRLGPVDGWGVTASKMSWLMEIQYGPLWNENNGK